MIAGRDSTAVTLSWLVYSLLEKPDIVQRLHEELRDFESRNRPHKSKEIGIPDAKTGVVDEEIREFVELLTPASLKTELPYLAAVISETLRLFPAVPTVRRTHDYLI